MKDDERNGATNSMVILEHRLASGEIDKEEYETLRRLLLTDRPTRPRSHRSVLSTSALTILIIVAVVSAIAVTSMALAYGPWRASQDGTTAPGGSWPWGGCCSWGDPGGGMGGGTGGGPGSLGTYDVAIVNYAYSPSEVRVSVGATVTWVNMDHVMHTVSFGDHADESGHQSGMDSGPMNHMDAWSFAFDEPGTYEYHCDPHPYMTGKVIVEG